MPFPEVKKPTYTLRELAKKKWCGYSLISDFFYLAEDVKLQICRQQKEPTNPVFGSDEEKKAAASNFTPDPIPIDPQEARQLEKKYRDYPVGFEPISLVITYQEKKRFEEEYSDQDEPDSTTHPQEKYPSLIGNNNDLMVPGYKAMLPHIGGSYSNLIRRIIHEPGFPINKEEGSQPWAWKSQLQNFKRNRKIKKHKLTPRSFSPKNSQTDNHS